MAVLVTITATSRSVQPGDVLEGAPRGMSGPCTAAKGLSEAGRAGPSAVFPRRPGRGDACEHLSAEMPVIPCDRGGDAAAHPAVGLVRRCVHPHHRRATRRRARGGRPDRLAAPPIVCRPAREGGWGSNRPVVMVAASARVAVIALAVQAVVLMAAAVRGEVHGRTGARVIRGFAGVCAVLAAAVALIPER